MSPQSHSNAHPGGKPDDSPRPSLDAIADLQREILAHNHNYYDAAASTVDDATYDGMLARLAAWEAAWPEEDFSDSPTQRVGGTASQRLTPVRHRVPMMSLGNTYDPTELTAFDTRVRKGLAAAGLAAESDPVRYVVEPKVDGVAVALTYRNRQFTLGATRGDGTTGENITANLKTLATLPQTLPAAAPENLELRGEVYFPHDGFADLNRDREAAGEAPFVNPRNAAAGTLRLLDSREVARRPLTLVVHGMEATDAASERLRKDGHFAALEKLHELGFPIHRRIRQVTGIAKALRRIEKFAVERDTLDHDTDGMVIKVDRYDWQATLGATAKAPRWAIAYKYAAERADTRVLDIRIQVGRTGTLTPVAHLEPVALAGTTVSRASLHNADIIATLDVRVGDRVAIEKGGDIIPKVVEVIPEADHDTRPPFAFPPTCPECRAPVTRAEGEAAHRCSNRACPAQISGALTHFAGRGGLDIDGLGPQLIAQLTTQPVVWDWIEARHRPVHDVADLFALDVRRVADLERMAERSAENLHRALQLARTGESRIPYPRVLFALGIRHVGARTAQQIAAAFPHVLDDHSDTPSLASAAADASHHLDLADAVAMVGTLVRPGAPVPTLEAAEKARQSLRRWQAAQADATDPPPLAVATQDRVATLLAAPGDDATVLRRALRDLRGWLRDHTPVLIALKDVGPVVAQAIADFYQVPENVRLLKRLQVAGVALSGPGPANAPSNAPLAGKRFVFTGTLSAPRGAFAARVEALGATASGSISKQTDYLVAGDRAGSKRTRAEALGVPVLDEDALEKLLAPLEANPSSPMKDTP